MARPSSSVVWSAALVCLIVGIELTVLGSVGLVASQPHDISVSLLFPQGTGLRIVTFQPAPDWGGRAVTVSVPEAPSCQSSPSTCPVTDVSVSTCLDPACQASGRNATGDAESQVGVLWGDSSVLLLGGTTATTFLFNVSTSHFTPLVLRVGIVWDYQYGARFAQAGLRGGSWLIFLFDYVLLVGLGVLVLTWILWRLTIPKLTDTPRVHDALAEPDARFR